jgi:hypothetical protein
MSEDPLIPVQADGAPQTPGPIPVAGASSGVPPNTVAPTGKRQAFRDIRRQIGEQDLANAGVQRMLLDELEQAESECESLRGYVDRYHDADKRAAVLEERMRTQTAIEVLFGVGVGVGGTVLGLTPVFWDKQPQGALMLVVGLILVIGSTIARVVKR